MDANVKEISVIRVVDDDIGVQKAIRFLLENEGWRVQVFSSGELFLIEEASSVPGCVILDIQMGGMSGLDVHRELIARGSKVPVIFLTAYGDVPMAVEAMKSGACDFLLKPLDPEKLLDLIEAHASQDVTRRNLKIPYSEAKRRFETLTAREIEVLSLAMKDLSNREISEALNLSKRTVESHRQMAYKKLDVSNVKEMSAVVENFLPAKKKGVVFLKYLKKKGIREKKLL